MADRARLVARRGPPVGQPIDQICSPGLNPRLICGMPVWLTYLTLANAFRLFSITYLALVIAIALEKELPDLRRSELKYTTHFQPVGLAV